MGLGLGAGVEGIRVLTKNEGDGAALPGPEHHECTVDAAEEGGSGRGSRQSRDEL